MFRERVHEARKVAAAPTLAAMRNQREKLPPPLSKLITYVVNHLFDFKLNADRAWNRAGITDHSLSVAFRDVIGVTLRKYIERCRLEIADRMVRTAPDVELMWIGLAVGYEHYGTFVNAYQRWLRETPSEARRNPGPPTVDYQDWRRFLRADLDDDAAWGVHETCVQLYPSVEERLRKLYGRPPRLPRIEVGDPRQERWFAEGLWQELRGQPFKEQKRLLRGVRFHSTVCFDLLREKSREEGRRDRQLGVELAELALLSLEESDDIFGERIHDLRTLGWAWLGNAQVLALDFSAAETALEKAGVAWRTQRNEPDRLVLGDLWRFKGTLRMYQRDYVEALRWIERSAEVFREAANAIGEVKALIQRAAIYGYTERWVDSLGDFSRAESLLEDQEDDYLTFIVSFNQANIMARAGRHEDASKKLTRARQQYQYLHYPLGVHEIEYVAGLIEECAGNARAAESHYLAALSGFGEARELFHVALCSLDLMSLKRR